MEKKKPLPRIAVNESFIQVPRLWVDTLMKPMCHKGKKNAPRIPSSFWLYSVVLWRHICGGNQERKATLSNSEFPVRREAAVRYSNAYSVSGVVTVEFGKYTAEHDVPNTFQCKVDATALEWECFIQALDLVLNQIKEKRLDKSFAPWGNTGGFRFMLAKEVDATRIASGLPPVNGEFIAAALSGKITDKRKRPIATHDKDGQPAAVFYPTSSHPRRGESEEEFAARMAFGAYDDAKASSYA